MKHDELAGAELLEVIEKAKEFLEQEKERGLELIRMSRETWTALEDSAQRADAAPAKTDPEAALAALNDIVQDCSKCPLASTRTNVVFGQGNPRAKLVFVGEAPGADEDAQGLAFVGRAGQLLTRIIEAIDLKRTDVFICNILKCRPPGNRTPTSIEIESCIPYLMKQLKAIDPKIICALGNSAAQTLLNTKSPMGRMRGRFHKFGDALLMPTYHPAALLRNPAYKKDVWEDVQMIQRELEKL
ncbi:MAG: uracil-DNA glycosylase [Candidatus Abyssubacteria bacterium]|nr:uracil-DNA glycosylase [Candidatus Abyssubacteria bacterium]